MNFIIFGCLKISELWSISAKPSGSEANIQVNTKKGKGVIKVRG